jgi:hypothetical protein
MRGHSCQHPLGDTPAIKVRFAEPPSDEGTGGGQIGAGAAGAVAVVTAACELLEADPCACPVSPLAAPDVVANPLEVPDGDPDDCDGAERDDPDGKDDVGTLSGSDPIPL